MNTTQNEKVRCLIIGSGPAGYTAAIYASRANLSPVLYEGIQPGGQLTTTTEVENFPGYPEGVTGTELMEDLRKQAARFGADIRVGIATETDLSAAPYKVTIDGEKVIETETLIISTGATAKYLGLPDEQKYAGMGVSACATCDGFFYRKKVVAVVGGGDTACEEALYLSSLAKQVYLIVRKPYLRASKVMQERVLNTPNITVLFEHNTIGLFGEDGVEALHTCCTGGNDHLLAGTHQLNAGAGDVGLQILGVVAAGQCDAEQALIALADLQSVHDAAGRLQSGDDEDFALGTAIGLLVLGDGSSHSRDHGVFE